MSTNRWTADPLVAVQRRALERALVDDVDARRYFALAGALDTVSHEPPFDTGPTDEAPATEGTNTADHPIDPKAVLPVALLTLAVVPRLDEPPSLSPTADPWTPGHDATRPAVRRGARLALSWFDVEVERVADRAGLPEAALVPPGE